jgi:PAS domain S-box-containing protein
MTPLPDRSIRQKLIVMALIASSAALVLACGALLAYEFFAYRDGMIRVLSVRADMIGTNSASAILFKDESAAAGTLASLKHDPHIISAGIYTQDNRVFAAYGRSENNSGAALLERFADYDGHWFGNDSLVLFRKIVFKGEPIGTVYIQSDLEEMQARIWEYMGIILIVFLVSSLVALVVSAIIERKITQPLFRLVDTARTISAKKDYSIRAIAESNDEMGVLVGAFNEMLTNIQNGEEKFRLMVEGVTDYAILMLDPGGVIDSWNAGAQHLKGYQADEIIGQHFSRLYAAEDVQAGKPDQELKVAAVQGRFQGEGWRLRKDGSLFWANVVITAMRDKAGTLRGFSKVTRDLTERKRVEGEIQTLNEDLERRIVERTRELVSANKELETFSYSVSHDLRTPLRGIAGFCQALVEDNAEMLDERGKGYLKRIQAATVRMGQLVDDLLDLAKVNRVQLRRNDIDLSALAEGLSKEIQQQDPKREAEFHIQSGLVVNADERLIGIVLTNLLENAWKFTSKQKRAHIEVGMLKSATETAYFVRDNGAGFDMAYANKLFVPFQRLHTNQDYSGTGIGLATVQRIVSRHGGRVWAEGEVEKGASLYFSLSPQL